MENHKRSYATIITTVALSLFALFWTTIDGQLKTLDIRLRCVERQIAVMSARMGIDPASLGKAVSRDATGPPSADRPAMESIRLSEGIEAQNER